MRVTDFSILREYVGPADQKPQPKDGLAEGVERALGQQMAAAAGTVETTSADELRTPFQFLHIHTLREYLSKEFGAGDYSVAGGFNLERAIDDFIFLCFFVGNDFLPHMPSLDIRNGAIDTLVDLYLSLFGTLGGWITYGGEVDLARVQLFCVALGNMEEELLKRHEANEVRFKAQQKKRDWEKANGGCAKKHEEMLRRVSALAEVPAASPHLKVMGGGAMVGKVQEALGRDAAVFEIFETIKAFSRLPDDAPPQPLLAGLSPYQRAMAYNYCDEMGVANEATGKEPNRVVALVKRGDGGKEPPAAKFKRELSELMKQKSILPEQPDLVQLGRPGWKVRIEIWKIG